MRALALILALLLAVPCLAQTKPETEPDAGQWFESLPRQRQELLKRRLRVLRAMKPEARQRVLTAAKEGKPVLTDQQKENLQKLRKLPLLQRVRLYTLAKELDQVRKAMPVAYERAMNSPERDKLLAGMVMQQRARMSLTPEQRRELQRKNPQEQAEFLRRHREGAEKNARERIRGLEHLNPRITELRKSAEGGDENARRELRQAMHDLATLDMLLQRLEPARRERVQSDIQGKTLERAAQMVQRELGEQGRAQRDEREKRPRDNTRPDERRGPAPKAR